MSILNNSLLLGADAGGGGYAISRSVRFNSSDSAYLSRTPASAGNRKTWTWAGWVKLGNLSVSPLFYASPDNSSNWTAIRVVSTYQLDFVIVSSGSTAIQWRTNALYRDPSAWYHIVFSVDINQASASDAYKFYVNGSLQSGSVNAGSHSTSYNTNVNNTNPHAIGDYVGGSNYLNAYLADIHFIDGQALTPTSFGEFSATTGVWMPKAYSGGSYGTNGFHLDFSNNASAAALGTDSSGLGNTWSVNNISVSNGLTSVAAATGALPVYNTTDTYGAVKGTGTRTDSNSSSIVLAVPMDGTNNGITFTDESATIKGSGSAKSITRNGDTKTSTTQSKFYGSSGYFDGSGDYLTAGTSSDYIFGTGDFTIECWAYFSTLNTDNALITNHNNDSNWVFKVVSGKLQYYPGDGNGSSINGTSTIGTGSWYHFSATRQSNTLRLFVNGVLETTATVSANYTVNNTLYIGAQQNNLAGTYLNGYLQDARIYKGVAKYTSNFNPPSSTQNPTLAAGNDSLVDVPTNGSEVDTGSGGQVRGNYCTWNPLDANSSLTISNGNLELTNTNSTARNVRGTIAFPSSGKWYYEITPGGSVQGAVGIGSSAVPLNVQNAASQVIYFEDGSKGVDASRTTYGASYSSGTVIGVAFDADSNQVTFYKNNVSQGAIGTTAGVQYFPFVMSFNATYVANFGQRPFAYTAPSGFKALCTANLPAPVVTKPSTVMDVKLYTGNGSTQTISGLGFSPDLVWTKTRSQTNNNFLFDSVRGVGNWLSSDLTLAEVYAANTITSFNSDGFTTGSDNDTNGSGRTFVAWTWDAGSSTVTNTQGSISSQVRANASAGFSVVTWTQASAGANTIGHGLGVAPSLVIVKSRSLASEWAVYHAELGATKFLKLNATDAAGTVSAYWNNTAPTSSVFSVGSWSNLAGDNLAYCFAPVAGYANAFSYSGNGSTDGPMVYLGFRPALIILKRTDSANDWGIFDNKRLGYNPQTAFLFPNASYSESASDYMDLLSNGFKIRRTNAEYNASGGTYVGFAWAESPFQYARAR
jgi:hypothetical protein